MIPHKKQALIAPVSYPQLHPPPDPHPPLQDI
ncbi:hypothetical protein BpOF4_00825 [Alkalihalophilus pseudofirmus OF4]|uniref:Uncharacterized protein n=1 Tax=Alkalihalophilus pseudofirmus (strain ATCC BAA-2126 / JCM 17055 / OF4) TaxID=398511 RepID=D3FU32_ALKPO|nr:hypothetical protein BpOF4_00825 [Alkalihalophilus pseudofirmus OF4]